MPAEELFFESRSTVQNSSYVGAVLNVSHMSRSTDSRPGTLASASYTRRRSSVGTLVYSVFAIKNSSSCMQRSQSVSVCSPSLCMSGMSNTSSNPSVVAMCVSLSVAVTPPSVVRTIDRSSPS